MLKNFYLIVMSLIFASSAFACWCTQENFNNAYIAGVNFYKAHYDGKSLSLESAVYTNGYQVSLPMTVWFKVSPRIANVNDEIRKYDIIITKLYYKVVPLVNNTYDYDNNNYVWRSAKVIDMGVNPKWRLDFNSPVQLFGKGIITKKMIESNGDTIKTGDAIILAWFFGDNGGLYNAEEITPGNAVPKIYPQDQDTKSSSYPYQYNAPYVMRVIYNGKTTLGR